MKTLNFSKKIYTINNKVFFLFYSKQISKDSEERSCDREYNKNILFFKMEFIYDFEQLIKKIIKILFFFNPQNVLSLNKLIEVFNIL